MKRGLTGWYEITSVVGEQIRAFVPHSLPPDPPLDLGDTRQLVLERALLALGRLDSISTLLPDPHLFLYSYVRREAVVSSQIVGIIRELTGQRRNRVFLYDHYLSILSEGTEPL